MNKTPPFRASAARPDTTSVNAMISAALKAEGRAVEIRDVQIAGIARARQAVVATRNVKHFERSCTVINPWEDA